MKIIVIAHNIRSTYNVGSIFRSCDGFGVEKLYLTGYTPYPAHKNDRRLPHEAAKVGRAIHKTALGAENTVRFEYDPDVKPLINRLKKNGYQIVALEQSAGSVPLNDFVPTQQIALVLGEEVHGIDEKLLNLSNIIIEIPMRGKKESFNVSVACGIALYALSTSPEI